MRRDLFAAEDDWAVIVSALADEAGNVGEARPLALGIHVKLAAIAGAVSGLLELCAERRRAGRHRRAIAEDAIEVVVSAREYARASRRTKRVDDKRISKAD